MTKTVMIWVQHLLGMGHIKRAALLAKALADAGNDVLLISGGAPVPGLDTGAARLHQLPWCRAEDEGFLSLLDEHGAVITDDWKITRRDQLLALADQFAPDAFITELFPFGRRQMRFELLPLLDHLKATRPDCRILCSLRDILVGKTKSDKTRKMQAWARDYYDAVLIHGDPAIADLDPVFFDASITEKVIWTGYLVDKNHTSPAKRTISAEVLVSAGSGSVGKALLETAMEARLSGCATGRPWRFLVGPAARDGELAALQAMAAGQTNIIVEPARPDFPALLSRCFLSISQGGYNTSLEILVAGCRSLIVPFAAGQESEQITRARKLAATGNITLLEEAHLTPQNLAQKVETLAHAPPKPTHIDLNGMENCVKILANLLG